MANCIGELKAWPLRGGVIVISIVSWLLALGFIAYFFGLYLGDVKRYGDRQYYMSVYVDPTYATQAWIRLIRSLKTFFDRLCREFLAETTETKIIEEITNRDPIVLAPYWAWKQGQGIRKVKRRTPETWSSYAFRLADASTTIDNETDLMDITATSALSATTHHQGLGGPQVRLKGIPFNKIYLTRGKPRPGIVAMEDMPSAFYPGLVPVLSKKTRSRNALNRYTQAAHRGDPFSLHGFELDEKKTTKSLRGKCMHIGAPYLDDILETVRRLQNDFVDSVQGRLHVVFLVLDLVMVLLNSILCVSSFMLLIGAHTKNRLLVIPWICISGVCVYGNFIYGVLHILMEHGMGFFLGAMTVLHIVLIVIIIVLHAVALVLVHRFMLNLFHRDRRRPRF